MKTLNQILIKINEVPGITPTELALCLSSSKSTISIYLKSLEREKLIKKYKVFTNKNITKIHPTKKGKDLYFKHKLDLVIKSSNHL